VKPYGLPIEVVHTWGSIEDQPWDGYDHMVWRRVAISQAETGHRSLINWTFDQYKTTECRTWLKMF